MAIAMYIGTTAEFELKSIKWNVYIERCKAFFIVKGIKETEKH